MEYLTATNSPILAKVENAKRNIALNKHCSYGEIIKDGNAVSILFRMGIVMGKRVSSVCDSL